MQQQQAIYRQITHERERESKCWSPELEKSISSGALSEIDTSGCKLDEEMSKKCQFGSGKWVFVSVELNSSQWRGS
jgi:hypothetical protein